MPTPVDCQDPRPPLMPVATAFRTWVKPYNLDCTVRVFISSTFRDMKTERNLLVKHVFPELRRQCRERGVELIEVDLRWGVTEDQAEHGEVLPICLAEIDQCRPYFVGLLGERYGWVPGRVRTDLLSLYPWLADHPQSSLTELEMLYAALNDPAGTAAVISSTSGIPATLAITWAAIRCAYSQPTQLRCRKPSGTGPSGSPKAAHSGHRIVSHGRLQDTRRGCRADSRRPMGCHRGHLPRRRPRWIRSTRRLRNTWPLLRPASMSTSPAPGYMNYRRARRRR